MTRVSGKFLGADSVDSTKVVDNTLGDDDINPATPIKDDNIYVTASGINKTLYQAILDNDIGGADGTISYFGNGADGALSLSGAATTTIARDMYYSSITLTGTSQLIHNAFRVYCSGTADIGSGCVLGRTAPVGGNSGAGGAAIGAQSIGGSGSAGAAGSTTVGANSINASNSIGGAGGAGGLGASGAGGTSGTRNLPNAAAGGLEFFNSIKGYLDMVVPRTTTSHIGGVGGGGGGGDGTVSGGGGGAGCNIVWLVARILQGSGTVRSNGGGGGSPASGNAGGGGGGGGGGIAIVTTNDTTLTSLTFEANGGTGGTASGTGVNGSNGAAGNIFRLVV